MQFFSRRKTCFPLAYVRSFSRYQTDADTTFPRNCFPIISAQRGRSGPQLDFQVVPVAKTVEFHFLVDFIRRSPFSSIRTRAHRPILFTVSIPRVFFFARLLLIQTMVASLGDAITQSASHEKERRDRHRLKNERTIGGNTEIYCARTFHTHVSFEFIEPDNRAAI